MTAPAEDERVQRYAGMEEPSMIDGDVSCFGCGYNLRGLKTAGTCPECGHDIGESLNGYRIFGDPAWVRRLRLGFGLGAATIGLSYFATIAIIELLSVPERLGATACLVITAIMLVMGVTACWLCTYSRRGDDDRRVASPAALVFRWSFTVAAGLFCFVEAMLLFSGYYDWFPPTMILCVVSMMIACFTGGSYMGALALEMRDPGLAFRVRLAGIVCGIAFGGLAIVTLSVAANIGSEFVLGLIFGMCGALIVLALMGVWVMALMAEFHLRLRRHFPKRKAL